jgi:hypothetical protein
MKEMISESVNPGSSVFLKLVILMLGALYCQKILISYMAVIEFQDTPP